MWCPACCPSGPWLLEGRGRGRATEVTREPCCSIWILLWIFKKCLWCLNLLHVTAWKQHLNSISVCYFLHLSCLAQLLAGAIWKSLPSLQAWVWICSGWHKPNDSCVKNGSLQIQPSFIAWDCSAFAFQLTSKSVKIDGVLSPGIFLSLNWNSETFPFHRAENTVFCAQKSFSLRGTHWAAMSFSSPSFH